MKYILILLVTISLICSLDALMHCYLKKETTLQKIILFILINSYIVMKKIKSFFQRQAKQNE